MLSLNDDHYQGWEAMESNLREQHENENILASNDVLNAANTLKMVRSDMKKLQKIEKDCKHIIEMKMGDAPNLVTEDGELVLTYKYANDSVYFDFKKFSETHPALYKAFCSTRAGKRTLLFKGDK